MTELPVETPQGRGRWLLRVASRPVGWLLLGHGAGGGVEAPDLQLLARTLPEVGVSVGLFEQPWRTSGRKVAPRPPLLDQAWLVGVEELRPRLDGFAFAQGGRSAGARVACRTATELGAAGVVNLAFPLHPPGRPAASRLPELLGAGVPVLTLQGSRDPFGGADEVRAALGDAPDHEVVEVPDAGHDLKVAARHRARGMQASGSAKQVTAAHEIAEAVTAFLARVGVLGE